MTIDREKIDAKARFDGKWVLRTKIDLSSERVALKYKELWQVEQVFLTYNLCWTPDQFFTSEKKRYTIMYFTAFLR